MRDHWLHDFFGPDGLLEDIRWGSSTWKRLQTAAAAARVVIVFIPTHLGWLTFDTTLYVTAGKQSLILPPCGSVNNDLCHPMTSSTITIDVNVQTCHVSRIRPGTRAFEIRICHLFRWIVVKNLSARLIFISHFPPVGTRWKVEFDYFRAALLSMICFLSVYNGKWWRIICGVTDGAWSV